MPVTPDIEELRNKRVTITETDGATHTGQLRGITPTTYWLGEVPVSREKVSSVQHDPQYCSACGTESLRLFNGLCATDTRKLAKTLPPVREPCEVCGDAAVRNPGTNEFLCMIHHAERGNAVRLSTGDSGAMASCRTEDVSSSLHEWGQVRGARFRCIRCHSAEKYDPDLLKQISLSVRA